MRDAALAEHALTPAMSPGEQRLLREAATGAAGVVEFGCGGSTLMLIEASAGPVVSVDTDAGWLARLAAEPLCVEAAEAGRWHALHADLGPVGNWGWPRDPARFQEGARYWGAPWALCPQPGFVLVDGRFRVACALAALRHLAPGGVLAIHDFWPRPHYHPILLLAELVGTASSLVLLARRAGQELPDAGGFGADPR